RALVYDHRPSASTLAGGDTLGGCLKLFLVRDAHADSEVPEGLDDAARALTHKARAKAFDPLAELSHRMRGGDPVLTSPPVPRARPPQIPAVPWSVALPLLAPPSLLRDMPVGSQEALLASHFDQTLVLVGHNPSMPAMAAHLLHLAQFPRSMSPGTVVGLQLK